MTGPQARVTAVCVVHAVVPGYFHDTAIDKRPRPGAVRVEATGLVGDEQRDRGHGGPDAAVYVYADEDAAFFADVLGRELPPGLFGENVRTTGLDVCGARIGERWLVGDVLLEVRKPRTPCPNLAMHVGVTDFHRVFHRSGRVGAMCRVLRAGTLAAGRQVVVESVPGHGVTVADLSAGLTPDQAASLLGSGVPLAAPVRGRAQRVLARSRRDSP
ncbi:MOSC domain-containing protein [Nocardioides koreensis]|uniref:MOSC domain-containing protein n=1 Tax=Nocardioides koreensis TaxID=433651 RepID=A0ABP5L6K0_9ACTN